MSSDQRTELNCERPANLPAPPATYVYAGTNAYPLFDQNQWSLGREPRDMTYCAFHSRHDTVPTTARWVDVQALNFVLPCTRVDGIIHYAVREGTSVHSRFLEILEQRQPITSYEF